MKFLYIFSTLFKNKTFLNKSIPILKASSSVSVNIFKSSLNKKFLLNKVDGKFHHTDSDNEELDEDFVVAGNEIEHSENVRNAIFKNYQDDIISELKSCVSVEELLNLVMKYKNIYEDKHITQTILVLTDLQKIFYQYNGCNKTETNMFFASLRRNEGFSSLLLCVKNKLDDFDPEYLSYVLYYLNKLGIPMENELLQNVALKVRNNLLKNFNLDQCARFATAIFFENSVRPYYLSLPIIPLIISHIEKCSTVEDLHNLTISLNKFHNLITTELLERYKAKLIEYLDNKRLVGTDYPTLLKIILFLNYPEWRDENILLIVKCILLLENEMNLLNVEDLTVLYEIFFRNQEPGSILNSIQRCSAKFLHQFDESGTTGDITRLKLFSSLIFFSSPMHRIQFRSHLPKYLNDCHNYNDLVELRKIFSYIKVSDVKLCENYWNSSLKLLNEDLDANVIIKFCQNYMHFNIDINNYRHYKFEARIMDLIKESLDRSIFLNPAKISGYLSFVMIYGKSRHRDVLEVLLKKLEGDLSRIKPSVCLKISHSLSVLNSWKSSCMSQEQIQKIKTLLNKSTKFQLEASKDNYLLNSILLKASILRNDSDGEILERLFVRLKKMDYMSSKVIETISYASMATQVLIPELIDNCTRYVVNHKDNILGFNAEKILFVCFFLGYRPRNEDRFFEAVTDVIIRDQERLSGLAYLQSALSLCYFNKLPGSFVKQIFNVEFMEKLDAELENCYSKDKYPQRVRNILMMLNRAVCLEYPEFNVPWFHKKYIEDIQKKLIKNIDNTFQQRVKEYLFQVLGNQQHVLENVFTPYGYHLNFLVNFNSKGETVASDSPDINRRVAVLLLRQNAFTRFCVHLRGKYQLKKRHLEIFGYEVAVVNFSEWIGLLHAEERLKFISKAMSSSKRNTNDVFR